MANTTGWHASPRRGEKPTSSGDTGEIRVPLALFRLDEHQGDTSLVLSRSEAEALRAALADHLEAATPLTDAR